MSSAATLTCYICHNKIGIPHERINLVHCPHCKTVCNNEFIAVPFTPINSADSMVQPGTRGLWQTRSFEVTGRCRLYFNESVFNYWTIVFGDGGIGWLLEGYGLFFVVPELTHLPLFLAMHEKLSKKKTGERIKLESEMFLLEQEQPCRKTEIEGQVCFPLFQIGYTVFELSAMSGKLITALGEQNKELTAYQTFPATQEELSLDNLRLNNAPGYHFPCALCATEVTVLNYPYAQSCVCSNCGEAYEMQKNGSFKNAGQRYSKEPETKVLDIGKTGRLNDMLYTVHGFAEKQEKNIYKSRWREYYLHNPSKGYAILSEFNGHWILLREAAETPSLSDPDTAAFTFKEKSYEKYNRYQYSLIEAAGEFPHNILNNENMVCYEYIAPPFIWVYEMDENDGIRWYFGEHIRGKTIAGTFTPKKELPYKKGTGAVSPLITDGLNKINLVIAAVVGFFVLLFIHLGISGFKESRTILSQQFDFDTSDIVTHVTPSFFLEKGHSNLEFNIVAPVANTWFELDAELVNTDDGKEYSFEQGVEYYSGYDEGESWSEGKTSETVFVNAVPKGNYTLQIRGIREKTAAPISWFNVDVKYDTPDSHSFWWALGFMLVYPLIMYVMIGADKVRRWMDSPFYSWGSDDEDDE
jgi:hypothetical protein